MPEARRDGNDGNFLIVGGDFVKKRMCIIFAAAWLLAFPLFADAESFGIFQGHIVDGALEEEESPIIQGHIVDGVIAEDGAAKPNAVPNAPSYTVAFQPGDGASVGAASKTVTNGRAYGELPVPKREGYAFDGWLNASGAKVTANTIVSLSADQILYAQWSVLTYEVRFDANGGSVKQISVDIPIGGDYGELPRPTRTGYAFDGWYTLPRAGILVADHAALIRNADHTLYAHWTPLSAPSMENYASADAFRDVPVTSCYYAAVRWAVEQGITSGTSPETFSPNDPCKRRHILTFLWRANGCPDTERAFNAVNPGTMWAYENALIPRDYLYSDEESATRSDAVTYLWKLAGSPTEETSLKSVVSRFTDVSPESECAAAVAWALDKGITNGTTDTTFSPERVCTRGQIVTFLYRCYTL